MGVRILNIMSKLWDTINNLSQGHFGQNKEEGEICSYSIKPTKKNRLKTEKPLLSTAENAIRDLPLMIHIAERISSGFCKRKFMLTALYSQGCMSGTMREKLCLYYIFLQALMKLLQRTGARKEFQMPAPCQRREDVTLRGKK